MRSRVLLHGPGDDADESGDASRDTFDDSGERGALGASAAAKHRTSGEWFVLFCS